MRGAAIEVVGDLAARNAITLHELSAQRASLEEAYMKLTDEAVEYRAVQSVSALAVLDAERIKLSTTRSPLWSAVAVAVLSLGLAALQGFDRLRLSPLPPEKAAMGVAVFGVPVLMILAAMTVTGEYRSGMIRTTFLATPNRTLVLVGESRCRGVFSGVHGCDGDRGGWCRSAAARGVAHCR